MIDIKIRNDTENSLRKTLSYCVVIGERRKKFIRARRRLYPPKERLLHREENVEQRRLFFPFPPFLFGRLSSGGSMAVEPSHEIFTNFFARGNIGKTTFLASLPGNGIDVSSIRRDRSKLHFTVVRARNGNVASKIVINRNLEIGQACVRRKARRLKNPSKVKATRNVWRHFSSRDFCSVETIS